MRMRSCMFVVILVLASIVMTQISKRNVRADQVIVVDVMYFIPDKSEFILDDKEREGAIKKVKQTFIGNIWDVFEEKKALGGTALGAPGDNNFDSNFPLVYKLPVEIKAGETGPWKMYARLNRTEDPNSFYWKASQDANNWVPKEFNIGTHGWNNPPGMGAGGPAANPLVIKDKEPWFWYESVGSPQFKPGENYLMLSNRESGLPPLVNLIDVICIRNDGNKPTDEEVEKLLAEQYKGIDSPFEALGKEEAVSPGGKLTTTWGSLKSVD